MALLILSRSRRVYRQNPVKEGVTGTAPNGRAALAAEGGRIEHPGDRANSPEAWPTKGMHAEVEKSSQQTAEKRLPTWDNGTSSRRP